MRILDKQGRFFGKINIVDLLICVVIVTTLAGLYFYFFQRQALKSIIQTEAEAWYMPVEVIMDRDDYWVKKFIVKGDTQPDVYGRTNWKILDIAEITETGQEKRIILKLRLMIYREKTGALRFGRYPLEKKKYQE